MFALEAAPNGAARLVWGGTSELGASDILKEPSDSEQSSALSEAKALLSKELAHGPVAAERVNKDARGAGVSERTLKRAKRALGVVSKKEGEGSWSWALPKGEAQGGQAPTAGTLGLLGKDSNVERFESAYLKEEGQEGQGCQADHEPTCIHRYPNGRGCYLCDPSHPHRLEQAQRGKKDGVTQHGDAP